MSGSMQTSGGGAPPIGQGLGGAPMKLPKMSTEDEKDLVILAQERFKRAQTWESTARTRFLDDLKFSEGDAYNNYQWPDGIRKDRDTNQRPCLTINKVRQHNLQIINDGKQNKAGIAVRPVGNEATYEAAQALSSLIRHIEYQSNAPAAYDHAASFQVRAGYGVLRVATDYCGEDFTTEIKIRTVPDPLTVLFDPDARQMDKSDSRFAYVFDDLDRKEFGDIYPQYKDRVPPAGFGGVGNSDWLGNDKVRICEYFYTTTKSDTKVQYLNEDGHLITTTVSKMAAEKAKEVIDDPQTRARSILWTEVHWALIVGNTVVEHKIWPGKYIPLVPVIGEETIIGGMMDRKGHTRALIDPQRMYNYWASAAVEFGALQTKTPFIAPAAAIEGLEKYWNSANSENVSVLPYNHVDDDGNAIPPPTRAPVPEQSQLYIQGMTQAQTEMMMTSGQYQAQMGAPSNERSGKAIQERQRQGDNATYHYIDNQALAIRQVGRIVLDLIPFVYNAKQVVQIMGEDLISHAMLIDPEAQKAYMETLDADKQVAQRILNPTIGKYSVEADVGPAYATKRQEAFNAISQILISAPDLTHLIGDILLQNGDFPGAADAAQRLKRMVPKQALGQGPSQAEQALGAQVQTLQDLLKQCMQKLSEAKMKEMDKTATHAINQYKAETDRFGQVLAHSPEPIDGEEGMADKVMRQTVKEMFDNDLMPQINQSISAMLAQAANPQLGQPSPSPMPGPMPQGAMP